MFNFRFVLILSLILVHASCDRGRLFEAKKDFEDRYWASNETVEFEFNIEDASQPYDLLYNVRNTNAYPFQNLYLQYYLEDSTGHVVSKELNNILLFDPVTGIPKGDGLGDIYSLQKTFLKDYIFESSGSYRIRIDHHMRKDTLPEIVSITFRIEKSID
jgi:gliding motility-associated lipoprotein GldH